jgi:hypothetical protein
MRYVGNPWWKYGGKQSFASLTDAAKISMERWSAQHSEFIVEIFLKNDYSVVKTQ